MSIIIIFINRTNIDKVLDFHNNAQSDRYINNNRNNQEFEWLFFNGPVNPAIYACAVDNSKGDIAGTQAGIFIPMINRKGKKLITLKGEDSLISLDEASKHGNTDILKELLASIEDNSRNYNTDLIWGLTPAKAAFRRSGYTIVTQIKNSYYVIKPIAFYKNRVRVLGNLSCSLKMKLLTFSIYNSVKRQFRYIKQDGISLKSIKTDQISEDLANSLIPEGMFSIHLNREYLRWRIDENPYPVTYEVLEARDSNGKFVSYIIMSHDKEDIWYVEHFLFSDYLPWSTRVSVIIKAFRHAKSRGAIFIRAPGFDHNKANRDDMRLLMDSGCYFFKNKGESYFIFKSLGGREINPENIYMSRLNTQGIR